MSLLGLYKGKDRYYLFSDNCQYLGNSVIEKRAPRQFPIQKFKNFVIGYSGSAKTFMKLVQKFDFDSFPETLTKSWLLRNFYLDFLKFLADETDAKIEDGALISSKFNIMIMGKDYAFDLGDEDLYEVDKFNANGDDKIAFLIDHLLRDEMSEEELIKGIMSKSVKYSSKTKYPFILVKSDDLSKLYTIYDDGSENIRDLQEFWRK